MAMDGHLICSARNKSRAGEAIDVAGRRNADVNSFQTRGVIDQPQ